MKIICPHLDLLLFKVTFITEKCNNMCVPVGVIEPSSLIYTGGHALLLHIFILWIYEIALIINMKYQ